MGLRGCDVNITLISLALCKFFFFFNSLVNFYKAGPAFSVCFFCYY